VSRSGWFGVDLDHVGCGNPTPAAFAIVIDTAATKNATKRTRMSLFMVILVHRSLTNPM
jgi:hypothetical protein